MKVEDLTEEEQELIYELASQEKYGSLMVHLKKFVIGYGMTYEALYSFKKFVEDKMNLFETFSTNINLVGVDKE